METVATQNPSLSKASRLTWAEAFRYILVGMLFGVVLIKSEVVSWYRIQEMFRLESFHMYGVIGSAVLTGAVSVWLIKRFRIKTLHGEEVVIARKRSGPANVFGGLLFGFGWALTGACPGPLFALVGAGAWAMIVPLLFAMLGTWVYGWLRERLPH